MNNLKLQVVASTLALAAVLAIALLAPQRTAVDASTSAASARQLGPSSGLVLYYRHGCPHCEAVETYLTQNRVRDKIAGGLDEVYLDRSTLDDLRRKAEGCGLPEDSIGVPFLWDGKKCLVGDRDIIEYFKQSVGAQ